MRCSRFLTANTAASVMWAVACSFGAYALGSASTRVGTALMTGGLAAVGLLTIVVALVMDRTIRRLEVRAAAAFPDPNVMPTSVDGVYRQPQQVLYPAPSTRHANPAKLNTNRGKAVPGQRNPNQHFVVHGGALLRSSPAGATRRMGELERTWTSR